MKPRTGTTWQPAVGNRRAALFVTTALLALAWGDPALSQTAPPLKVVVLDANGVPVTQHYRFLLEEDRTLQPTPGVRSADALALTFHRSYMPPVASGTDQDISQVLNNPQVVQPDKRYFLSILPDADSGSGAVRFNMSGVNLPTAAERAASQLDTLTVRVTAAPLPTAQVVVQVFEDTQPINGQHDQPQEAGLAGFTVLISDAGGRYGQVGGQLTQDAFGKPLGTTYKIDTARTTDPRSPVYEMDPTTNLPVVDTLGDGTLTTDAQGVVTIKNLPPGKYGIKAVGPDGSDWVQTTTIEGTLTNDAWVKANEPPYFAEFGPPGPHVFFGFTHTSVNRIRPATAGETPATIRGKVVNLHMSRPPQYTFFDGGKTEWTGCFVGLNDQTTGQGTGVWISKCDADGGFEIPNVPQGNYQLVIWDENLDYIFGSYALSVKADGSCVTQSGSCDLATVPVFQWFTRLETRVFFDDPNRPDGTGGKGWAGTDSRGIPQIPVRTRFRDGTIDQVSPTDGAGSSQFNEVFPYFNWQVVEVDAARFKPTGATVIVDAGGPVEPDRGWDHPSRDQLTPQPQMDANGQPLNNPYTNNNLSRVDTGRITTEGFQGFIGQTSVVEFGLTTYGPNENGGIQGTVSYATVRAEDDPRHAKVDPFEPGIPRVPVLLYKAPAAGQTLALADVPAHGSRWIETGVPGPADQKRVNGKLVPAQPGDTFNWGDAIGLTWTEGWDDKPPTGCQGNSFSVAVGGQTVKPDCYDGLRNFNQVRPATYDGRYHFQTDRTGQPLPTGSYVVEVVPPKTGAGPSSYEIVKEEDKSVPFGTGFIPSPLALPPACVGDGHVVPAHLSMFPNAAVAAPFAGQTRPLCDRKLVTLNAGQNATVEFQLFTKVPIAGHFTGMILNDLANEFDPTSPNFGEKHAPAWVPVSIRDWTGQELYRTYADEWGRYNGLLPSTFTNNIPSPSGVAPSMMTLCMNDPGPIADPAHPGRTMIDPHFDKQYSQFCYTFMYMPGTTTYLDTPVLPVSAFTGPDQVAALDCEFVDGTPKIYSVDNFMGSGPVLPRIPANGKRSLRVVAEGPVQVANPLYTGPESGQPRLITRDYGFGTVPGTISIGGQVLSNTQANVSWSDGIITFDVPRGWPEGELVITRGDNGQSTINSVTVTLDQDMSRVRTVQPGNGTIQAAIDAAQPGDVIVLTPGLYNEAVIMWKPVRLQGVGSGSVTINPVKAPAEKLVAWRNRVQDLITRGVVDLVPGQTPNFGGIEPGTLNNEEGAGVLVLGANPDTNRNSPALFTRQAKPRIDGIRFFGADHGGAITVNGYGRYLEISNNHVSSNQGFFGGGIRVGHPDLLDDATGEYSDAQNDSVNIHHNAITHNGGLGGAGGGVSLCTGAHSYKVSYNWICGNFNQGDAGGIAHLGFMRGSVDNNNVNRIEYNRILFNQSFMQQNGVNGGGITVSGQVAPAGSLSRGSGNVQIVGNTILGNQAGTGDGGGIRLSYVNGRDVQSNLRDPERWNEVDIVNNMIVNNMAGLAGGAISLQDSLVVGIINNTIAHNDSTATAATAFAAGNPADSIPQPAGIVSRAHTTPLAQTLARAGTPRALMRLPLLPAAYYVGYSNPDIRNNIIWRNRSFHFHVDATSPDNPNPNYALLPDPSTPVYDDMRVLGTAGTLSARSSLLTGGTSPMFLSAYVNGARNSIQQIETTTAIQPQPAFDEGGNYIDIRFGPLSLNIDPVRRLYSNYHVDRATAPQVVANGGDITVLKHAGYQDAARDIDGEQRSILGRFGIGADQITRPTP